MGGPREAANRVVSLEFLLLLFLCLLQQRPALELLATLPLSTKQLHGRLKKMLLLRAAAATAAHVAEENNEDDDENL